MAKFTRFFNITAVFRFVTTAIISLPAVAYAMPADHYAASSVLASGKWAKVNVNSTGMQLITTAQLRNLGFNDPDKVRVYGYGGAILPEYLNESNCDDLPPVPSVRTAKGIVFFGSDAVKWSKSKTSFMEYQHTPNPYSDHSFYFITDSADGPMPVEVIENTVAGTSPITSFNCRLLHEQDLEAAGNTGRVILGEDFRVQASRNFNFSLPGNIGDKVNVRTTFGSRITGGEGALVFSANGNQLGASSSDKVRPVTSKEGFLTYTTATKSIENAGDNLTLNIRFTSSGALFVARLDYIEVEYERELAMRDGELHFYADISNPADFKIEGVSDETLIWDVTDPVAPKQVKFSVSGSSAVFNVPKSGYHEFIAFNPSAVSKAVTLPTKVANQDIHSMPAPGMLLITPAEYITAAQRIADLHAATDGLDVLVLTPEQIYNEFSSGSPDVTAFRKLLKMWYDRAGADGDYTRYCLILSRPSYDNKMVSAAVKKDGYPRVPIWQDGDMKFSQTDSYSTDDYIGMLSDSKIEPNMDNATIHVAVGRMPVKSLQEAMTAVDKLEKYVTKPELGGWRNNILLIADDQDSGQHLDQSNNVYDGLTSKGIGPNFLYERLYLDAYPLEFSGTGPAYPQAKERMMQKLSEGVAYIEYIGHANTKSWTHEGLLTWTDITNMTNTRLPFLYAATCEFLRWDDDDISGAEEMWLNPNAGVIGMICPSRKVYVNSNGTQSKNTSEKVFELTADGLPKRVGDFFIQGKNTLSTDNKLRYGLMGDPAMRFTNISLNIAVDSIAGVALADAGDNLPEVAARSRMKVSGHVSDLSGNAVDDFNGVAVVTLYDAERVITTYGNGAEGTPKTYNDRKTRLFSGRTKVTDGKWSMEILMPSEIENNYSPALLNIYAYDETGREGAGSTTDFFVYGYDQTATDDSEGPEITKFVLNGDNFKDGAVVSPSPLVIAEFNDPSGINLSGAGLGHKLALSLDGEKYIDALDAYYEPDMSDITAGKLTYPLSSLEAGKHTLDLIVWDNANNSSTARIEFNVDVASSPGIADLSTDVNPARTSVVFSVSTDRALEALDCTLEVFDLSGALVWSESSSSSTSADSTLRFGWNLKNKAGARVDRGIYLYRATVTGANGATSSKTKKLAVTAP